MSDQQALHNAFLWIRQLYEEARYLLEDGMRRLRDQGLTPWSGGWYSASKATLASGAFPFVYLAGQFAAPKEEHIAPGTGVFLFVSFHAERHTGPMLLAGTVTWSDVNATPDHWLINVTARLSGFGGLFGMKQHDGITRHVPTDLGRAQYPSITEVRHIEIPLTVIAETRILHEVLDALIAMRKGEDMPIRRVITQLGA